MSAARWPAARPVAAGVVALAVLMAGLGTWAVTARLSGAVVAGGIVRADPDRRVVQHPDGGVVEAVLVREGAEVRRGQVLIRLRARPLATELAAIKGQLREIAARRARLSAERDAASAVTFPAGLTRAAGGDRAAAGLVAGERGLFELRRAAFRQARALLEEENRQIRAHLRGLESERDALKAQADLVAVELRDHDRLLRRGLTRATRVRALRREAAALAGRIGRVEADMAQSRGRIASNEIARHQLVTRRREEAARLLRDLEYREIELQARKHDLQDRLSQLEIRAPADGILQGMAVSQQAVIGAAEPLAHIVPGGRPPVVSARVDTVSVTDLHVGQVAVLRFPGLGRDLTPEARGRVTRVSADAMRDAATGTAFYAVEVTPDAASLRDVGDGALRPGMPVEVFFQTGARAPIVYLAEPVLAFFSRALRE